MTSAIATSSATIEELSLLPHVVAYEWRKATAFRGGFIVNGILRGLARPVVMGFVYLAMFASASTETIGGYTFAALVHYLVWTAVIQKCLPDWRTLDLAEQIFDGYVTKFLVMPVSYFTLLWGRLLQFLGVQVLAAILFWVIGAALAPRWWPHPVSGAAFAQATILLALGTCCYWLTFFILNALAFWLDVVWSLLNMFQFVASFVSGLLVPVALMPRLVGQVFKAFFPYWAVNAPIEILLGRLGTGDFIVGFVVLALSLAALNGIAVRAWRGGLRRYAGVGT